jgi:hypothetical protein
MKLTNEQRRVVVDKIYDNLLKEIKPLQDKELADFTKKHKKEIEELEKANLLIKKYNGYVKSPPLQLIQNFYSFQSKHYLQYDLKYKIADKLIFESISTTNIEEIITNITNSFKSEILK